MSYGFGQIVDYSGSAPGERLGIDSSRILYTPDNRVWNSSARWAQRGINAWRAANPGHGPQIYVDGRAGPITIAALNAASPGAAAENFPTGTRVTDRVLINRAFADRLAALAPVRDPARPAATTTRATSTSTSSSSDSAKAGGTAVTPASSDAVVVDEGTSGGLPSWLVPALVVGGIVLVGSAVIVGMSRRKVRANRRARKNARRTKYGPGARFQIGEGSGFSAAQVAPGGARRYATAISWSDRRLKFDGHGIPRGVPGAYSEPDRDRWVAIEYADGSVDVLPKGHLRVRGIDENRPRKTNKAKRKGRRVRRNGSWKVWEDRPRVLGAARGASFVVDSGLSFEEAARTVTEGTDLGVSRWMEETGVKPHLTMPRRRVRRNGEDVGYTIVQQLGGHGRLSAMIGAKNWVNLGNGVQFSFAGKKATGNKIVIKLNARDTYDVEFWWIRGADMKLVHEDNDVYADSLRSVIESQTGMRLSLNRRRLAA